MGIASKGNTTFTIQALDDWYLSDKKDYAVFAEKYPLNGELNAQANVIQAMQHWGETEKITHTPTIFINGYEIPAAYTAEDLKYILV